MESINPRVVTPGANSVSVANGDRHAGGGQDVAKGVLHTPSGSDGGLNVGKVIYLRNILIPDGPRESSRSCLDNALKSEHVISVASVQPVCFSHVEHPSYLWQFDAWSSG